MSDSIIKVEGLGKKYIISHEQSGSYTALRDVISKKAKGLMTKKNVLPAKEEFWALKDLNFEIKRGEAVGIIGRNGAGKSTLLKILSRITEPSTGRVEINGRVASLLEVGTGFHPELTGRENLFLNGAILGMSRSEIRRKFDEIVDFSGVEKFLDTPVKRYSSGMYIRLAFAVAAHLEPEILVVDEVLAVGDGEFQKKCLGKMDEVSKQEGRTVLFVSHNMGAVMQLCNKSILMNNGSIVLSGTTTAVIDSYLQNSQNLIEEIVREEQLPENHFKHVYLCNGSHDKTNQFGYDEEISMMINLVLPDYNSSLELAMRLMDRNKNAVFTIHEPIAKYYTGQPLVSIMVTLKKEFITPGTYSWIICINHQGVRNYDVQDDVLSFTVIDTGSEFTRYDGANFGVVFADYKVQKINSKI